MDKSIISKLKLAKPDQRANILQRLYRKNRRYLKERHPAIDQLLQQVDCPYEINITDDFLEIVHKQQGSQAGQSVAGLDFLAAELGGWSHQNWIDFIDPALRHYPHGGSFTQLQDTFIHELLESFPEFESRFASKRLNLPETKRNQRFSNPVVFVGIFHGLHVAHYLAQSQVRSAAFLEPEPERFEISCYFLDFAALDKRFDGLLLHVGANPANEFFDVVIRKALITSAVWLRVLPGYTSERIEPLIQRLQLRWCVFSDEWVSSAQELRALQYGINNLHDQRKLLTGAPELSPGSRVAVVGAGPSLTHDLDWLQENQKKLILFVAHSAVRPLLERGIVADFQFCLDLELSEEMFNSLKLDASIPIVTDCRVLPKFLGYFEKPLLVADPNSSNLVNITYGLTGIKPTTGNLAIAFACLCRPTELYLLGMDFGFRQKQQSHASGTIYDDGENKHEQTAGNEQMPVLANFADSGEILTRAYFNNARVMVEQVLRNLTTTQVYNLSDGARIQGAIPQRSLSVDLPEYSAKKLDLTLLEDIFKPARKGIDWLPFSVSEQELLQLLQTHLCEDLSLKKFTWIEFTERLDLTQRNLFRVCQKKSSADLRMLPYLRVIRDLLITWYRIMIFTNSPAEAEHVYRRGLKSLLELVSSFEWPDGLDALRTNPDKG